MHSVGHLSSAHLCFHGIRVVDHALVRPDCGSGGHAVQRVSSKHKPGKPTVDKTQLGIISYNAQSLCPRWSDDGMRHLRCRGHVFSKLHFSNTTSLGFRRAELQKKLGSALDGIVRRQVAQKPLATLLLMVWNFGSTWPCPTILKARVRCSSGRSALPSCLQIRDCSSSIWTPHTSGSESWLAMLRI